MEPTGVAGKAWKGLRGRPRRRGSWLLSCETLRNPMLFGCPWAADIVGGGPLDMRRNHAFIDCWQNQKGGRG